MPVLVVDALEVVHVEHGHGVLTAEPEQRLVQGASGGEPGEAVLIGHVVGGFHHGHDEDERAGREVERGEPGIPWAHRREAEERRNQRPGEGASGLRGRHELGCREQPAGDQEGQQGGVGEGAPREQPLRQEPRVQQRRRGARGLAVEYRHERQLPQDEGEPGESGRCEHASLRGDRQRGQVERQQHADRLQHDAVAHQAGPQHEVHQGPIGEGHYEQGEQQAAAMEAPAQEHAGAEDGVRVERREPGEHVLEPLGVGVQERREDDRGFGEAVGEELPDGLVGVRLMGRGSRHGFAGSLGTAAGLRVSRTGPRSTVGLRAVRLAGDIFAAVAVSSRGLGRSPLKAQTRVRIPLPL